MYTNVNNIPNVKMLTLYLMVLQFLNDKNGKKKIEDYNVHYDYTTNNYTIFKVTFVKNLKTYTNIVFKEFIL